MFSPLEFPRKGVQGYVAFLLHAHLPYIPCHPQQPTLEEKWLFEALTESYLPLLICWRELSRQKLPFQLTLSLSPTLISMLLEERTKEAYSLHLKRMLELAEKEMDRTRHLPQFKNLAEFYFNRLGQIKSLYEDCNRDLLSPLRELALKGHLELITTCATHGYLPLMLTWEARRAQNTDRAGSFRPGF